MFIFSRFITLKGHYHGGYTKRVFDTVGSHRSHFGSFNSNFTLLTKKTHYKINGKLLLHLKNILKLHKKSKLLLRQSRELEVAQIQNVLSKDSPSRILLLKRISCFMIGSIQSILYQNLRMALLIPKKQFFKIFLSSSKIQSKNYNPWSYFATVKYHDY